LNFLFFKLATDQALNREQGVRWVSDRLSLGRRTDQNLAVILIGNDGRRRTRTLGVLDHLGLVALHDRNAGIGGSQIDANDFAHDGYSL
jgi:hypothetical protein